MVKKTRQGSLRLVLLGSVTALGACQPSPPYSTRIEQMNRPGYANQSDCVLDWGSRDQCEEDHSNFSYSGHGARYWGPYYSNAGQVYGYDGVTRTLSQVPSRAVTTRSISSSESQLYTSGQGRYAGAAKASRGGFGGGGKGGFFSGGG